MRNPGKLRRSNSDASPRRVVILGFAPVDALDVIGPAEVFSLANTLVVGAPPPYKIDLISAGASTLIQSESGIALMGHRTLVQERRENLAIDTLIVAAGLKSVDFLDREAIAWVHTRSRAVRRVCSICIGAFALAETGLLNGRRATTHWYVAQHLRERYPKIQVDPAPIWIKDGKFYTSAGITAGIDLALSLVAEDLGEAMSLQVAKTLVLFLRRPSGQAQFSVSLQSQSASGSSLAELCHWISEHLTSDLTVEALAQRQSVSVRTAIRMFHKEMNTTPAKYVEAVRLEAACRALEFGALSLKQVANQCGYGSLDVLRKAFLRRVGVTPRQYAQRFAPGTAIE